MDSSPRLTKGHFERSVMAVPPLARDASGNIDVAENTRLIRHMEAGGVSLLLYGGNANIYHLPLTEYDALLAMLATTASASTLVVPAVGPTYGLMLEHAKILRKHAFQTAMVLPQQGITTSAGVATGARRFVEAAGIPALLSIKHDGFIDLRLRGPETLAGDAHGDSPWRLDGGRTPADDRRRRRGVAAGRRLSACESCA